MAGYNAWMHDIRIDAFWTYLLVEAVVEADYCALGCRIGGREGDVLDAGAKGGAYYSAGATSDHRGEDSVDEGNRGAEILFEIGPPVGEEIFGVGEGGEALAAVDVEENVDWTYVLLDMLDEAWGNGRVSEING